MEIPTLGSRALACQLGRALCKEKMQVRGSDAKGKTPCDHADLVLKCVKSNERLLCTEKRNKTPWKLHVGEG